jgi:hypothetical protein
MMSRCPGFYIEWRLVMFLSVSIRLLVLGGGNWSMERLYAPVRVREGKRFAFSRFALLRTYPYLSVPIRTRRRPITTVCRRGYPERGLPASRKGIVCKLPALISSTLIFQSFFELLLKLPLDKSPFQ